MTRLTALLALGALLAAPGCALVTVPVRTAGAAGTASAKVAGAAGSASIRAVTRAAAAPVEPLAPSRH